MSARSNSIHNDICGKLVTREGNEIAWVNSVKCLGVCIVASRNFRCTFGHVKKSFYRSFNAVFGKVGRIASETVVVELFQSKCLPVLLYGIEECHLTSKQKRSLNYAICSCYRKIFNVKTQYNTEVCMAMFNCDDFETLLLRMRAANYFN